MPIEKHCEFCGAELKEKELYCPKCGTFDQSQTDEESRFTVIRPRTVEELNTYCNEHGIPMYRLGFFVDEDLSEPGVNGIYRDGERVLVYENAPNGFRNLVYAGPDEEAAVGLYFGHLLDICHANGIHPERMSGVNDPRISEVLSGPQKEYDPHRRKVKYRLVAIAIIGAILAAAIIFLIFHARDGYYSDGSELYYRDGTKWYFNIGESWVEYEAMDEEYPTEFLGSRYNEGWGGVEFTLTDDGELPSVDDEDGEGEELTADEQADED